MSLRTELRKQTKISHQMAEQTAKRLAPVTCLDGYQIFLSAMFIVYCRYAGRLDLSSQVVGIEQRGQQLTLALGRDLELVGPEENILEGKNLDDTGLLGIAYAFEGSALGASHLLCQLHQSHLAAKVSCDFLTLLCQQSSKRWPSTLKALSHSTAICQEAIDQARGVFQSVALAMEMSHDRYQQRAFGPGSQSSCKL